MIRYSWPVPPEIEALLNGIPGPFDAMLPARLHQVETYTIQVRCRGAVVWERAYEDLSSVLLSLRSFHCRRPKVRLVLSVWRRNLGTYRFTLPLQFDVNKDVMTVVANDLRVREWLKSRRSTVARKSRKTPITRHYRPRPSPEERFLSMSFFVQRGPSVTTNTKVSVKTFRRTWTGTTTPAFRSLKKRYLPVNNHTVDVQTNTDGGFIQVFEDEVDPLNSQVFLTPWTSGFGAWTSAPPDISHQASVGNVALQRLVDRMGSKVEGNLAQDMAQLGQLNSLLTSTVQRITGTLTALKRKDFSGAVNRLWNGTFRDPRFRTSKGPSFTGSLANNWLELQYGWKPLLMDIHGTMNSLAKFYELGEHVTRTVTATARSESITSEPITEDALHVLSIGSGENWVDTRVRYGLRYKIDSHLKAFLAQTGFTNPLNLVWEVLPYSFVVDWFLPVGAYLEALGSFDGLEFVDGFKVTFTRQRYIGIVNFSGTYAPYSSWQRVHTYGTYRRDRIKLDREKLTSFPRPDIPRFKNPLSVVHALNGLALLRTAFGR